MNERKPSFEEAITYNARREIDAQGIPHIIRNGMSYTLDVSKISDKDVVNVDIKTNDARVVIQELVKDLISADERAAIFETFIGDLINRGLPVNVEELNERMEKSLWYSDKEDSIIK